MLFSLVETFVPLFATLCCGFVVPACTYDGSLVAALQMPIIPIAPFKVPFLTMFLSAFELFMALLIGTNVYCTHLSIVLFALHWNVGDTLKPPTYTMKGQNHLPLKLNHLYLQWALYPCTSGSYYAPFTMPEITTLANLKPRGMKLGTSSSTSLFVMRRSIVYVDHWWWRWGYGLYRAVEQKDRVFTLLVCFKRRGGRGKLWGGS